MSNTTATRKAARTAAAAAIGKAPATDKAIVLDSQAVLDEAFGVLARYEGSDLETDLERAKAFRTFSMRGATDGALAEILTTLRGEKVSRQYVVLRRQAYDALVSVGVDITPANYKRARIAYGVTVKGAGDARASLVAELSKSRKGAAARWDALVKGWAAIADAKANAPKSVAKADGNRKAVESAPADAEAKPDTSVKSAPARPVETVLHWIKFAETHAWSADDRATLQDAVATLAVALES